MRTVASKLIGVVPLVMAVLLGTGLPVRAIVDANSRTNTTLPPDGAPWAHVGPLTTTGGAASGVYVGAGWVLTAYHVGPGDISLKGITFHYDGTSQRLTNSNGSFTDMILFHLSALPPLPALTLATRSPNALSPVDLVGCGRIAGSVQSAIGAFTGFYWSPEQVQSWGNNTVSIGGVTVINTGAGVGDVSAFAVDFTAPGVNQNSHEAQAAAGDSGGAVFQLKGSTWQLAGMLDAITALPSQPPGTSVFGNQTYSADIATYAAQITAVIASTVPKLSISHVGTNVLICWPDTGVAFDLEATATLSSPAWLTPSTSSLVTANGQVCATVPVAAGTRFFRLQKHSVTPQ